ncbi:hypothetical protein [Bradyrhizobium neotropicale]|uniref:hypothetical protein n=1 Tax=Bradyrhizobium neotropicale TaxID=1497615 RepID=UPI001AD6473B|nr:hypothetical protein [Bradyrhizobium neotropicale]MBO4226437.1 hypothetical protein [Bradyrhizobium neotropicale]
MIGGNFSHNNRRIGISVFMTDSDNSHIEGAIQMLLWAIEEIQKTGNNKAERHARSALKYLRAGAPPNELTSRRRP